MHIPTAAAFSALLASSLVSAATLPSPHNLFSPRTDLGLSVDVCAYIDVKIQLIDLLGLLDLSIDIAACLCLDVLVEFCDQQQQKHRLSNAQRSNLLSQLSSKIQHPSTGKTCTYPSTCTPTCAQSNPCHYDCPPGQKPGTDRWGNPTCVCADSNHWLCNGQCVPIGQPCASSTPQKRRVHKPAKPYCPRGQSVCGIYEQGGEAWECVDTQSDLESCGGCAIPFSSASIPGTDCTQIPHVYDVGCVHGACQVVKCKKEFVVSPDGAACIANASYPPALLLNSGSK